jgi:hypothetical protein
VPNSEFIIFYFFEYHVVISMIPFVLAMPRKLIVISWPMNAIDVSNHPKKNLVASCAIIRVVYASLGPLK